jgi:DedD protein
MVKDAAKAPLTEAPKPVAKDSSKDTNKTVTPSAPTSKPVDASNASSAGVRYVVQVAAFAEAAKAREVRIKLEAQGYKTYSQAIDSPKGKVWRVRVGPFDNKAAAEKAKSQLSGKGFQPALLEL